MNELIVRIISGIVGIAIAAVVIQLGGLPFTAFAILLSLIGWHEFSQIMQKKGLKTTYILGALTLILILFCAWLGNIEGLLAAITLGVLLILLMMVILHGSIRPIDACVSVGGVLYIGLPFAHLIFLRFLNEDVIESFNIFNVVESTNSAMLNHSFNSLMNLNLDVGCMMIWLLFICTWSSDTFAYFVGVTLGSHKLASTISPKKSVEGFIGGILGTTAMAVAVGHYLFDFPLIEMAILGCLIAIIATLGDLVESVMKRFVNIKDSGVLLPGHGGMLDRFDSIFYTAPFFYYFVLITGLV